MSLALLPDRRVEPRDERDTAERMSSGNPEADYILGGGSFSSRITQVVRNDNGLAYTANASVGAQLHYPGAFNAFTQTKNSTVVFAAQSFATSAGLVGLDPKRHAYEAYDEAAGLPSKNLGFHGLFALGDELLVATTRGIARAGSVSWCAS